MNVITQSGNIGKNCETRFTPAGKAISVFSLATTSGYGDNKKTTWVSCKLFGDRWTNITQYLVKGAKVVVTGSFTVEEWEHEGKQYSKPVSLVNDLDLPPKAEGANSGHNSGHNSGQSAQQPSNQGQQRPQSQGYQQPQGQQAQQRPQNNQGAPMAEPDFDFDDDLPPF